MQYKAVPVTEYVLVYRKRTDLLIDWHIRNHPDKELVAASKITDGYETTNVWRINPKTNSEHPAAFPTELAVKVISYYSFKGDVVMDPFAGSGTVGRAAVKTGRRFVLYDSNLEYVQLMQRSSQDWLGKAAEDVLCINVSPISDVSRLF
jgi:DNA modification methylase